MSFRIDIPALRPAALVAVVTAICVLALASWFLGTLMRTQVAGPVEILEDRLETMPDMYSMPSHVFLDLVPGASRGVISLPTHQGLSLACVLDGSGHVRRMITSTGRTGRTTRASAVGMAELEASDLSAAICDYGLQPDDRKGSE